MEVPYHHAALEILFDFILLQDQLSVELVCFLLCCMCLSPSDLSSAIKSTMAINVPGLVVMVFFYLMVLGTGIWASMKSKKIKDHSQADQTEVTLLGNRGIPLIVGVFTTTGESWKTELSDMRTAL